MRHEKANRPDKFDRNTVSFVVNFGFDNSKYPGLIQTADGLTHVADINLNSDFHRRD